MLTHYELSKENPTLLCIISSLVPMYVEIMGGPAWVRGYIISIKLSIMCDAMFRTSAINIIM